MDDIIIYSAIAAQHLSLLAEVLVCLHSAGLKINPAKTTLIRPEVKYLSYIISAAGVKPDIAKVQAVYRAWPHQLQSGIYAMVLGAHRILSEIHIPDMLR